MYGLVNRSMKEYITLHFGDGVWEKVKETAGIETDTYISNRGYDDQETYAIVGALSQHVGLTPTEMVLKEAWEEAGVRAEAAADRRETHRLKFRSAANAVHAARAAAPMPSPGFADVVGEAYAASRLPAVDGAYA